MSKRIALVVGARPNYFKAKPILRQLERMADVEPLLVHTGQHYDNALFEELFQQLDLRRPDVYLGEAQRDRRLSVAEMIMSFSTWCIEEQPDAVIVVGDVDSTMSCALAAAYNKIPVIHVEAGLRSFDRAMPEEINRTVTDTVSRLLLVSDPVGVENLKREGRSDDEIRLVGNVMIDTLLDRIAAARETALLPRVQEVFDTGRYALLTMHRPSNVDDGRMLRVWGAALREVAARIPVVFPVHPRTQRSLLSHDLLQDYSTIPGLLLVKPMGYLEIIKLQEGATFVMTDSAGIQEETSVLATPCLTLRTTTERPITVSQGTSVLVHEDPKLLLEYVGKVLDGSYDKDGKIELWDGKAAERVAAEVRRFLFEDVA